MTGMISKVVAAFCEGFRQGHDPHRIEVFEATETERLTHRVMCGSCSSWSEVEFVTMEADGHTYYQIGGLECCDEIRNARHAEIN